MTELSQTTVYVYYYFSKEKKYTCYDLKFGAVWTLKFRYTTLIKAKGYCGVFFPIWGNNLALSPFNPDFLGEQLETSKVLKESTEYLYFENQAP